MKPALGIGFVAAAALAASAAPLSVYALSLGAFGLVHVLTEVRYVDERFRRRLARPLLTGLLAVLAVIVLWRLTLLVAAPGATRAAHLELGLVVALALIALVALRPAGPGPALLAAGVAALLTAGALRAPLATLVVLAVLHNLTPVGFLAERLRGAARRRAMIGCALAFGLVPIGLASGLLRAALGSAGLVLPEGDLWRVGGLDEHLGVFVPAGLAGGPRAIDLFAAVVYLQVLHYAVVIHVLPRLGAGGPAPGAWPPPRVFARVLGLVGAVSLVAFALSFHDARRVYGVFAAFHAWLEVPILLLALGGAGVLRARPA